MYKITTPLKDRLMMPYRYHGHSWLFLADIEEETLTLLDLYENSCDKPRVFKAFYEYIRSCKSPRTLSDLKHIKWKEKIVTNRYYQAKSDTTNCTLYVMFYIERIGNMMDLKDDNVYFDPVEFRKIVAETLILKSEDISNRCMNCFSDGQKCEKKEANQRRVCKSCNRWVHCSCSSKSNVDTED